MNLVCPHCGHENDPAEWDDLECGDNIDCSKCVKGFDLVMDEEDDWADCHKPIAPKL